MDRSLDCSFMKIAIEEAVKGQGKTSPNPIVGSVLVRQNQVIAKGYHSRCGGPHAEIVALKKIKGPLEGASLYVTLEPCSTFGKTPPCVDEILHRGLKRVVIGSIDPNPLHCGRGIKSLRKKGISVEVGVLKQETDALIRPFRKWITKKIPFCIVKSAVSLDGKTATATGESKWISGSKSRAMVHKLRSEVDAVLVGINTVIKDDPELTPHQEHLKNPFKVIVDSSGRIPLQSKLLRNYASKTIIATTDRMSVSREKTLLKLGAKVIRTSSQGRHVNLKELFLKLGQLEITFVLAEGGGDLAAALFKEKLVDEIVYFWAPILIGGKDAPTGFDGEGLLKLNKAIRVTHSKMKFSGSDIMVTGEVRY